MTNILGIKYAKLVREHINFERGLDPKEAMNIGLTPEQKLKLKQQIPILKRPSPLLGKNKHNNKVYSRGYQLWKLLDYIKKGEDTGGRRYKELVKFYYNRNNQRTFLMGVFDSINRYTEYTKERGQKRVRLNNRYFLNVAGKRFLEKYRNAFDKKITESLNFERGLDPKDAMSIGKKASDEAFVRSKDWSTIKNLEDSLSVYDIVDVIRNYKGFSILIVKYYKPEKFKKPYMAFSDLAFQRRSAISGISAEQCLKNIKNDIDLITRKAARFKGYISDVYY